MSAGVQEGDDCNVPDCAGVLEYIRESSCSCHISAPCRACVEAPLKCNTCDTEPCCECGATSEEQARTMCICNGEKDDCHGCELWPD